MDWSDIFYKIPERNGIIHCMVGNNLAKDCADLLLGIGVEAVFADYEMEVKEITAKCDALLLNAGNMEAYEAMLIAGKRSHSINHPVVLDVDGINLSEYRKSKCLDLVLEAKPTCIRGNILEIAALSEEISVIESDGSINESNLKLLADKLETIIIVSGEKDLVCDAKDLYEVRGGTYMFRKISGSGIMTSSMIAAALTVENSIEAIAAACRTINYAGEMAAKDTINGVTGGIITFRDEFINLLSILADANLKPLKKRRR